jgi:hypothetical protein
MHPDDQKCHDRDNASNTVPVSFEEGIHTESEPPSAPDLSILGCRYLVEPNSEC